MTVNSNIGSAPAADLPHIYANTNERMTAADIGAWVEATKREIELKLATAGAILFRGFPVRTAQDFDTFVSAFGWENFPYRESLSNAVRVNRTPRVFTANEAPPTVTIHLHHEMAQTPVYPAKLFFFCEQPAETGGATPICPSHQLWEQLLVHHPQLAHNCERLGLRYSHTMPAEADAASGMGRSWRDTLGVADQHAAESRLTALGYTWQWQEDGSLRVTTPRLPAVRELGNGRKSFFNQLIAAYCGWQDSRNDPSKSITYGDGSPLDAQAVAGAVALANQLSRDVEWQQGDIALLDNFAVMHGRKPFTGTRKVLASLGERTRTASTDGA